MIQNVKNIKSKFRIDLEYFSLHTCRFNGKLNSQILENLKKCTFSKIKNFQSLVNQNLKVFSMVMCSEKFPKVKDDFKVLITFFRKCQQFFISTFLMRKCPKSRRIWDMLRPDEFLNSISLKNQ